MSDCLQSSVDFYSPSPSFRFNYLLHSLPRQPTMFRRNTSVLNEKCYIPSPFSSFPSSSHCIASRMCYEEEIWLFYRIGCNWVGFVLLLFNSSYVLTRKSFTCSLPLTFVPVLVHALNGKIQKHLILSAIFSFHRQGIVSYFCKMHTWH